MTSIILHGELFSRLVVSDSLWPHELKLLQNNYLQYVEYAKYEKSQM